MRSWAKVRAASWMASSSSDMAVTARNWQKPRLLLSRTAAPVRIAVRRPCCSMISVYVVA
jgi:hypothetical protein